MHTPQYQTLKDVRSTVRSTTLNALSRKRLPSEVEISISGEIDDNNNKYAYIAFKNYGMPEVDFTTMIGKIRTGLVSDYNTVELLALSPGARKAVYLIPQEKDVNLTIDGEDYTVIPKDTPLPSLRRNRMR